MGDSNLHGIKYRRHQSPIDRRCIGISGLFGRSRRGRRRNGSTFCENVQYFRCRCGNAFHLSLLWFLSLAFVEKEILIHKDPFCEAEGVFLCNKKGVRNIKSDGSKVYILFIYLSVGRGQMMGLLL